MCFLVQNAWDRTQMSALNANVREPAAYCASRCGDDRPILRQPFTGGMALESGEDGAPSPAAPGKLSDCIPCVLVPSMHGAHIGALGSAGLDPPGRTAGTLWFLSTATFTRS